MPILPPSGAARRAFARTAAVVIAVTFAGCGSTTTNPNPSDEDELATSGTAEEFHEPPVLKVAERGFTNTMFGVTYGLVLRNPSQDTDAVDVHVRVGLIDSSGDVIDTVEHAIAGVPAGGEFVVGGEEIPDARVRRLEIDAEALEGIFSGALTLPETRRAKITGGPDDRAVRVQIRNTLPERSINDVPSIYAVLRARNGKIIGGTNGSLVDRLGPGDRTAVRLRMLDDLPRALTADASADGLVYESG